MAQLFSTANGECSAHEIVTFAPCTSIPQQYYIVGASQASATNTFTVTSDGNSCGNNYIVLDQTVISPSTNNVFQSSWQDGSGFSSGAKGVIQWQTNDYAKRGTYTVQQTVSMLTCSGNHRLLFKQTCTFYVEIIYKCSSSSESTISLTASNQPITQTYKIGDSQVSQPVSFSIQNSIWCTQSDIVYSFTVSPSTGTQFISYSTTLNQVTWYTSTNTFAGTYTVTVTASLTNAQQTLTQSTIITLEVIVTCYRSTDSIALTASTSPGNLQYLITTATQEIIISQFTLRSQYCADSDVTYSQSISPSNSFIIWSQSSMKYSWATSDSNYIGTYTITVTGMITRFTGPVSTSLEFKIIVQGCESVTALTITPSQPADQTYYLEAAQSQQTIPQFTTDSSICTQAYLVYSMTVIPTHTGTAFITFDPSTRVVLWQTSDFSQVGEYTIEITGKITAKTIFTETTLFKLTVTAICSQSTEIITVTPSTAPNSQKYTVGDPYVIQEIFSFTESSSFCDSNDISYSMLVTPETSGQSVGFISFTSSSMTVLWQTNSNAQDGVYSIMITGTISAATSWHQSLQFSVTVQGTCDKSIGFTISAPANLLDTTLQTLTYIQGQAQFWEPISNFTENDQFCTTENITYNMVVTPTTPNQNSSFIHFYNQSNIVSWYTNFAKDAGVYQIEITGSITNDVFTNSATASVTLIVINADCATSSEIIQLTTPALPSKQIYLLSHTKGQLAIGEFTENSTFCTQLDIAYQMMVTAQSNEQDTRFIKFQGNTRVVSWETSDDLLVGNYTIQIFGILKTIINSFSFILEVKVKPVFCSPVLKGLSGTSTIIGLSDLKNDAYNFGPVSCTNAVDITTITYTVNPVNGNSYFKIDPITGEFRVTDRKGLLSSSEANYKIKVILKDQNGKMLGNSAYIIKFELAKVDYNIVTKPLEKVPFWNKMIISNLGKVQIYFSEQLVIPANATKNVDSAVLNLKIVSQNKAYNKYQKFSWKLIDFKNSQMTLQLVFQNPMYISALGEDQLDQLLVTCLDNQFFISQKSLLSIEQESFLIKWIPVQLSKDKSQNSQMGTFIKFMNYGAKSITIGTLITNLLLSCSLNLLWGMINALQIIGSLPKFNLYTPANIKEFYGLVNDIQTLNFIPTDTIFVWLSLASDQNDQNNLTISNSTRILTEEDDTVEVKKSLFQKLGPLFLMLPIYLGMLILLVFLMILRRWSTSVGRIHFIKKFQDTISYSLCWNSTLKYIIEGYLALTLESMIIINNGLDWSTGLNRNQALFSIITMIVISIAPLAMSVYFTIRFNLFRNKDFLLRFSSVIGDFNYRQKISSIFISIFCYRRLVMSLLIVFLPLYPYAQVQLMTLSCVFVIILYGYSNVYQMPKMRKLEFFNEATILLCCYHVFCFTDFVDDPIMRYDIGFSLIAFTTLNLGINIFVMLLETFKSVKRFYKVLRHKCRKQKLPENIKQSQQNQEKKIDWLASYMVQEAFDEEAKKQRDRRKLRKLKKSKQIMKGAQNLQEIEEVESNLESSNRQHRREIPVKLKKSRNINKLTTGQKQVNPEQHHIQRDDSWTNFYAPMFSELPNNRLDVPIELSEEEKKRKRQLGLYLRRLTLEHEAFMNRSEYLLEDIQQTQQQKSIQLLTEGQQGILEIADLLRQNNAIYNVQQQNPMSLDAADDPEQQFASEQEKGK